MFFGGVVKQGKNIQPSSEGGEILHLSQACLHNPTSNGKSYLNVLSKDGTFSLCALMKDKCEHASFDLFIPTSEGIELSCTGPNEIHVVGYYEPDSGDDDMMNMMDEEADEVEDELEDDAELSAKLPASSKTIPSLMPEAARQKAEMLAKELQEGDDSGDESGDDSDDEQLNAEQVQALMKSVNAQRGGGGESTDDDGDDDDDDDEDDDDDDDDEEMDEEAVMQAINAAKLKAAALQAAAPKSTTKGGKMAGQVKRKADAVVQEVQQPPAKKVKKSNEKAVQQKKPEAPAKAAAASGDDAFQKAVVDHLKAHGRTSISMLGSQVKKPASVKKLGAFIKERPTVFKVENGMVSLAKH